MYHSHSKDVMYHSHSKDVMYHSHSKEDLLCIAHIVKKICYVLLT